MPVELNHSIVWCRDKQVSAGFMAEVLGRPAPIVFMHFLVVKLDNGASLDFFQKDGAVSPQHYAFLVDEAAFDAIFRRIEARGIDYWADPARTQPGKINRHFGGRGVYFRDPDDHLLEVITRPYEMDG